MTNPPIETPIKKSRRPVRRFFQFVCLLILIGLIAAGVWLAYPKVLQFKQAQSQHQIQLTQTQGSVQTLQSQLTQVQTQIAELQEQLQGTKAALTQVTGQLQTQQSMLTQIRQDPAAKNLLPAEINYLIQLAHTSLIAQHNTANAIMFLKTAQNLATVSYDAELTPVVTALNQDISELQSVDQADVSDILAQIATAKNLVEQLTFSNTHASESTAPTTPVNMNLPWWKKLYVSGWNSLKNMVVVEHTQGNAADSFNALTQEYLKQNIELLLTQTELAVAQYNQALYQANLSELENLIENHLLNQPQMNQVLTIVKTLQSANIAPPLPDVDASQIAINQVLNGPRAPDTAAAPSPTHPAPSTATPLSPPSSASPADASAAGTLL